jgi:hypothetical protein
VIRINLLHVAKTHEWLAAYMEYQAATLTEGARILRETAERNRVQFEYRRQYVRRAQPAMLEGRDR